MSFKDHPYFFTATILEWKPLLKPDKFKDIIISSLAYLVKDERVAVYGFVIMNNHIHVIWQIAGEHLLADVQHSFMKYTAQIMLKELQNHHLEVLKHFKVNAKDRQYQIWERNPLSVALWNRNVFLQKLEYIHLNPVRAGLADLAELYKYSSAAFYLTGKSDWTFLSHYEG